MVQRTNEEYLENNNSCPFCNSEDVQWNTDEGIDGDSAFRYNECNKCKREWVETYTLVSYEEVL